MLKDVIAVEVAGPPRLQLTFEDGLSGEINVARLVAFKDVFAPLANPGLSVDVRVSADAGTVVWPNGADLDPDILYAKVSGVPVGALLDPALRPMIVTRSRVSGRAGQGAW